MSKVSRQPSEPCRSFGGNNTGNRQSRSRIGLCVAVAMCAAGTATAVKASGPGTAQIVVGPVLDIESAETSFYLRVGGPAEAVPPRSFILIQGLPPAVELSGAERAGPGTWVVSLSALEYLTVKAPAGFVGGLDIVITLFDGAGTELAARDVHLNAKVRVATGRDSQQAEARRPSRAKS